jgi:hypothetical protein
MQAEEPKQPGCLGAEGLVRVGEHGPDVGSGVIAGKCVEAAMVVTQLGGQGGQRQVWIHGGPGGGDRQSQGKPGTLGDDLVGGIGLGGETVLAEAGGQQMPGLLRGGQVQLQRVSAIDGDQSGKPVAAGDQHHAAGRAG